MSIKRVLLVVAYLFTAAPVTAESKTELESSALADYDFSFLPEVVVKYKDTELKAAELMQLLKPRLAKLNTTLVSQNDLKDIIQKYIEERYQRQVKLELALAAGYSLNVGIAELELAALKSKKGQRALLKDFEFTGLKFADAPRYYAESKVIDEYFDKVILPLAAVNEADALVYFVENEKEFFREPSVKIAQLFFSFFDRDSRQKAHVEAEQAMNMLVSGMSFAEVAKKKRLAIGAENGGLIEKFFTKAELRPALRGAFDMVLGSTSSILMSGQGYHIVKLVEKKPAEQLTFEVVKERLIQQMKSKKASLVLRQQVVARLKAGSFKLFLK